MAKNNHCRVVVLVDSREVVLSLVDSNGDQLEEERFGLSQHVDDISPRSVATDIFQLLYQCASDAVHTDDD